MPPLDSFSGAAVAAVLGPLLLLLFFVLFPAAWGKKRRGRIGGGRLEGEGEVEEGEKKGREDLQSDGPDVIIVGAGVAGAALAYTLGKVGAFSPDDVLHRQIW